MIEQHMPDFSDCAEGEKPHYVGDDIYFTETPIGMFVTEPAQNATVKIESPDDAKALIESLQRYLQVINKEA